jgi:hypothetical protein
MSSKRLHSFVVAALVASGLAILHAQSLEQSASNARRFYADDPMSRDDDMRNIPPPAEHDLSKSYEFVANTFGDTAHSLGPALNANTVGEVPDSSWFTNRLGVHDMTIDEVLRGPSQVDGPAPGPWQVTGRPDAGITPKFTIRDARGDTYLIKLDPPSNPELPSSVELISTKIFHAIGYHVPQDFIVSFDRSRLTLAPGAKIRNTVGDRVPIQPGDVEEWLRRVPKQADGSIRALASRYVPGKVVGQYMYTGQRSDDPNDLFPHERRRELRGLRVFAAWLNHDDASSINSIDTYVEDNGRHYIRHYLQDFGSNLGSGSTSAQQPRGGYEYLIEGHTILKGLASFGLYERDWMKAKWPKDPSIGNIEADVFDPATWKTEYPNPAFNRMDAADAFWAASIVSRFTNPMIQRIVEDARLSSPDAAAYLADVIIRRRDKVVRWGITQTVPLDRFEVRGGTTPELSFDNAAVRLGYAQSPRYSIRWASFDNRAGTLHPVGQDIAITALSAAVPADAWGPADDAGLRYAVASIAAIDPAFPHWANPVMVTIRNRAGAMDVVGIERPTGTQAPPSATR